ERPSAALAALACALLWRGRTRSVMRVASFRRLFERVLLASIPMSVAVGGAACGSATPLPVGTGDGVGGAGGEGAGGGASGGGAGGSRVLVPCVTNGCSMCKAWDPALGTPNGTITPEQCRSICGGVPIAPCTLGQNDAGMFVVSCQYGCLTGRRPAGLAEA